ncbi:MAG: hypothetical protein U0270_03015 [Labilithrix sp.]
MAGYTPEIEAVASTVLAALRGGKLAYVEGPVGSGRNALVDRLNNEADVVAIELLPLTETDAPAAALVELANLAPGATTSVRSTGAEAELHSFGRAIGASLREGGKAVVLRVPESWRAIEDRGRSDDVVPGRAAALLHGLFAGGSVALVADAAVTPERLGFHAAVRVPLRPHDVPLSSLEALSWGTYQPAFNSLLRTVGKAGVASPLAWRLAVGALHLGAVAESVRHALLSRVPIPRLAQLLAQRLRLTPEIALAVTRFLVVRRPVARDAIPRLTGVGSEHEPLLTMCIGYGGDEIRVTPIVRSLLNSRLQEVRWRSMTRSVHEVLAAHYQKSDGALSPNGLDAPQTRAWCEKVHHLAHAGAAGASEWAKQEFPTPEFYWDRGRYLSVVEADYAAAARVYQACVSRFPDDDYAWHYRGFNLHRAGATGAEVEAAFRTAVKLAEENPWWNSRLVTFLNADGQPRASYAEWKVAVERVDPEGTIVRANMWLARNFHRWVFREWVNAGRTSWAREVYDLVPERVRARGNWRYLQRQLENGPRAAWRSFLQDLESRLGISADMASKVRRSWDSLASLVDAELPLPMGDMTSDNERFQFAWSYRSVLVEVEVHADGTVEWFGKDRKTGKAADGLLTGGASWAPLRDWMQRVIDA